MKISTLFELNKTQRELDFIDIDTNNDLPLFIDPYFLSTKNDEWSFKAYRTIQHYFQTVLSLLEENKSERAKELFRHLKEPNETCLGVSQNEPRGRGVGNDQATKLFDHILSSKAIESGVVGHLEDIPIFVENVGKDKISDLATNVIRKHLIEYTQSQCKLHDIPLTSDIPSGYFWNPNTSSWENELTDMLVVDDRIILLVPKGIVSYSVKYTPEEFCNHFVLTFRQSEHVRLNTDLVKRSILKDGSVKIHPPTKKELREIENAHQKSYLTRFTVEHPEIYKEFQKKTKEKLHPLTSEELEALRKDGSGREPSLEVLIDYLKEALKGIEAGNEQANDYHDLIVGILQVLFYPSLICPYKEVNIHGGRKRIDITYDNAAESGIFHQLHDIHKISSQYIIVECKNYSKEIANPEIDQLSGRFSPNRGRVGLLLCRTISNKERALARCTDTYKDDRGLIVPLEDKDILDMLEGMKTDDEYVDQYLRTIIRNIILK